MKITAFDGSPRRNGNSTMLLRAFIEGAETEGADAEVFKTDRLEIKSCRGCLMCNTLKRCAMKDDKWNEISDKIMESDVLVFSTPIYFHHASSTMKRLLDRFRSFINVRITPDGIEHEPHIRWRKKLVLLTAHGSSSEEDAAPLVELFRFMTETMGPENSFSSINAVRLAVSGQIGYERESLEKLYEKLDLPVELAAADAERNRRWLDDAFEMGRSAASAGSRDDI